MGNFTLHIFLETLDSRMTHYSAVPSPCPHRTLKGEREILNQPIFYPILEKAAALAYLEDINLEVYIWEYVLLIV